MVIINNKRPQHLWRSLSSSVSFASYLQCLQRRSLTTMGNIPGMVVQLVFVVSTFLMVATKLVLAEDGDDNDGYFSNEDSTIEDNAENSASTAAEYYRIRRAKSKPWLMREFHLLEIPTIVHQKLVENTELFVPKQIYCSPFTILCVAVISVNVYSFVSYHLSGTWVEASHILVKDTSSKTEQGLISLKEQIGTNYKTFCQCAKQYSGCPSSEDGGELGRFGPTVMTPPFDRVCFDPEAPLNVTIGPIQTQHGYHLIYITKRKL